MSRTNSTMLRSEKAIQAAVGSGDASRNLSTVMISFSSAAKRDAAEFTGVEDRVWQDSNAVLECQSAHCQVLQPHFISPHLISHHLTYSPHIASPPAYPRGKRPNLVSLTASITVDNVEKYSVANALHIVLLSTVA